MRIPAADPRLATFAPLPPTAEGGGLRLDRFDADASAALAGQPGPLANLRSSSGCAWLWRTDSPTVTVTLTRLRHHQPVPCHVALEVRVGDRLTESLSSDLREHDGEVVTTLATGLERGQALGAVALWLPPISTCALAAIDLADGARLEPLAPPRVRWLAIGDSLTQGFSVASPLQTWVHRLARRWHAPVRNLGVAGIRIEPAVFAPALQAATYDLVTIALGSNHAWNEADASRAGARAAELAAQAAAGRHQRIAWILPPWKPFEDGKGPADFAGVPLDRAASVRMARVRAAVRSALEPFTSRIQLVDDTMPHDLRLLPDGLHPHAWGSARYAQALAETLQPPPPAEDGDDATP